MIAPGTVGVGEPAAQTKQIDNASLTNPDAVEVERQLVGIGDPEDWSRIAKVRDSDPDAGDMGVVVRPVGGSAIPDTNYDSGLLDVPVVATPVTALTTQVRTALLINDNTQIRHFTLLDGDGNPYITDMPVAAKTVLPLDFGGAALSNGISVNCKAGQTGLRVQFIGRQ